VTHLTGGAVFFLRMAIAANLVLGLRIGVPFASAGTQEGFN